MAQGRGIEDSGGWPHPGSYLFFPTALAATHNVIIIVPLCMSHRHYRMYI